jgi:hypothetical protein
MPIPCGNNASSKSFLGWKAFVRSRPRRSHDAKSSLRIHEQAKCVEGELRSAESVLSKKDWFRRMCTLGILNALWFGLFTYISTLRLIRSSVSHWKRFVLPYCKWATAFIIRLVCKKSFTSSFSWYTELVNGFHGNSKRFSNERASVQNLN